MSERRRAAERICSVLRNAGYRALFAGGCVRDMLLGHPEKDFDIATNARPEEVQQLFGKTFSVGAAFGVILVQEPEGGFEVATFRRDGPYEDGRRPAYVSFESEREDAFRRDFTINAMFMDPQTGEVIDFVNGREDLARGIIRAVGVPERRFHEDHLRLLRAVRFAARLSFELEPATRAAATALSGLACETSPERVRDELVKMLTEGAARRAFELLDETGMLAAVLPEIAALKGVQQPPEFHPEGDVWTHTLLLLEQLVAGAPAPLALAALLHDVGKPATQSFEDRIRFNNHDRLGAEMTRDILRRLHFSNEDIDACVWLVSQHMRLAAAPGMRESKRKRFVREPYFELLLELCEMDCVASHGDTEPVDWARAYIAQLRPDELRPAALLRGQDLIAMGYAPGPMFGEALREVEDLQLEGRLDSTEAASAFVRERWPL